MTNRPCLEEMAYFLFSRHDIEKVLAEVSPNLATFSVKTDTISVGEIGRLLKFSQTERNSIIVWNITDGTGPFSGSHVPSFARLSGVKTFGNTTFNQLLSQDKFKTGILCRSVGVPVPNSALYLGRTLISRTKIQLKSDLFVKPCSLDNKIGIFCDARAGTLKDALDVSDRIHTVYGDSAVVQSYISGKDLRISYLNVDPLAPLEATIGVYWSAERRTIDKPFTSYEEHLASFLEWDEMSTLTIPQDARLAAKNDPVFSNAMNSLIECVARIVRFLGLKDYFSFDFRIQPNGRYWLMELNTAPFLRNKGMRDFIQNRYSMSFGAAVAAAILNSFALQSSGEAGPCL